MSKCNLFKVASFVLNFSRQTFSKNSPKSLQNGSSYTGCYHSYSVFTSNFSCRGGTHNFTFHLDNLFLFFLYFISEQCQPSQKIVPLRYYVMPRQKNEFISTSSFFQDFFFFVIFIRLALTKYRLTQRLLKLHIHFQLFINNRVKKIEHISDLWEI